MQDEAQLFPLLPPFTPDLSPKTGWASLFKDPPMIAIPLYNKDGEVVAWTKVDLIDAAHAEHCWRLNGGYAVRAWNEDGRTRVLGLHRAILGLGYGDRVEVDHANRDKLDNRRQNLRLANRAQQAQNIRNRPGAASLFRGVTVHGSGWRSRVVLNRTTYRLGTFRSEIEAAQAAEAFRSEHMPYAQPDPELAKALA